jgi:ABC-type sugar transport system permease subunit
MPLTRLQRLILAAPFLVIVGFGLFLPLVLSLLATFTNYSPIQRAVQFVGLGNIGSVLGNPQVPAAVRNVIVLTVVTVPIELLIGIAVAVALRHPFRGRSALRIVLLVPWLVSPIAAGVMWHFLLTGATSVLSFASESIGGGSIPSPLGLRGLALPTVIVLEIWRSAPLAAFLLTPAMAGIPSNRWEQAELDGMSALDRLRHVVIPGAQFQLLAVALLLCGAALGTFDAILILTGGGPATETVTPALFSYREAYELSNWPVGSTAAWLSTILIGAVAVGYLLLSHHRGADFEERGAAAE